MLLMMRTSVRFLLAVIAASIGIIISFNLSFHAWMLYNCCIQLWTVLCWEMKRGAVIKKYPHVMMVQMSLIMQLILVRSNTLHSCHLLGLGIVDILSLQSPSMQYDSIIAAFTTWCLLFSVLLRFCDIMFHQMLSWCLCQLLSAVIRDLAVLSMFGPRRVSAAELYYS